MDYVTIYQYTFPGTKLIHFIPLTLFAIVGFSIAFLVKKTFKNYSLQRQLMMFLGYSVGIITSIGIILFLFHVPSILKYEKDLKINIRTNNYLFVEGKVENYNLVGDYFNNTESFTINGVKFEFSDNIPIDGFHKTAFSHGPINRNGIHLKVYYLRLNGENAIMKLEILQKDLK